MTYPAGAGVVTGNYGPYAPSTSTAIAGGSSGISVVATAPGAPANVAEPTFPTNDPASYNFTNRIMSSQEAINGANGLVLPQQGVNAIANVTSVTLAGYSVGACSFVQTVGAYNSVK
jgi:hypothetical protein